MYMCEVFLYQRIHSDSRIIQSYREDPEWKIETYIKAAEATGISPIQAYKWGYHQRIKQLGTTLKSRPAKQIKVSNINIRPSSKSKINNFAKRRAASE